MKILLAILLQTNPWGGWKEGTAITVRTTTSGGANKVVKEEKFTVVKVAPDSVTVKVETSEPGNKSTREDSYGASSGETKYGGTEKGKETIAIDGTKLNCVILEESVKGLGNLTGPSERIRRWVCADAPTPGGLVKEESADSSFKLTKLKATVTVKGQSFTCWVTEGVRKDEVSKTTGKIWYSKDMPGWKVKSEVRIDTGSSPTVITTEIIALDLKK
jgi:hypothetical protein